MASSRRTTAGLAPKQVSHTLTQIEHDGDLSLSKRPRKEQGSKKNASKLANAKAMRGYKKPVTGISSGETSEEGNEDAEESDEDDHIEDGEDPEVFAPSGGKDTYNQKLRVDSVSTESIIPDADDRQAGLTTDTLTVPNQSKKRSYSNVSILTADEDSSNNADYPRKKANQRLSGSNNRLVYDTVRAELKACMDVNDEEAVMASDDDDDVYAVLDEAIDSQDDDTSDEFEAQAMLAAVADTSDEQLSDSGTPDIDELPANFRFDALPDEALYIDMSEYGGGHMNGQPGTIDNPLPLAANAGERKKSDVSERRVRFDDHPKIHMQSSSSSSDASSEFEGFPDLLSNFNDPIIPQEQLGAALLQQIEEAHHDAEIGNYEGSDSGSSYWDYGESLDNAMSWHDHRKNGSDGEGSEEESEESTDGYDSDGDTTDDDIPPPTTISRPKTNLHRRSPPSPKVIEPGPERNRRRRGPVMGTFVADSTKPYATYDHRSHSILIEFPRNARNAAANGISSTSTSPNMSFQGHDFFSEMPSLFPAATADVMMSGVFGAPPGQRLEQNGSWVWNSADLFGGQIGLPESFYPSIALDITGTPLAENEGIYSSDEEDDEDDMDIHAFIDMTDLPSDAEEAPELDAEETETTDAQDGTETATGRARSASQLLLEHFDRDAGTVSAFKNHHDRFRRVSRLPQDASLIATPLKTGKTAEDLMSPMRKRKSKGKAGTT